MGSPVYLRDLKPDMAKSIMNGIRDTKKLTKEQKGHLLKAIADGQDIKIGEYAETEEYEVS